MWNYTLKKFDANPIRKILSWLPLLSWVYNRYYTGYQDYHGKCNTGNQGYHVKRTLVTMVTMLFIGCSGYNGNPCK